jgi:two-component system NarL family sensor kinase
LAKLQLNSLHLQPHPTLTIGKSVGILTKAIQSLSELSRHLGTPLLQDNGLIAAIAADVQKLNASGRYQAALNIAGQEVLLDANTELLLFRIVQESIANFVKHAQATTLHINLHYDKTQLQLQVVDNGCGFNPEQTAAGAGLSNIRKRTRLLKGQCEIHSQPGNTTITIIIPLHDNNT